MRDSVGSSAVSDEFPLEIAREMQEQRVSAAGAFGTRACELGPDGV